MAPRNPEKAKVKVKSKGATQKILHRFQEALLIEEGAKLDPHLRDQRPKPSECTNLSLAEDVCRTVVREISKKISKIQDPILEEAQLRMLNEEINRLVQEKQEWDRRVLQLGGIERNPLRWLTQDDQISADAPPPLTLAGKYYFGRAKELPEYQEALRNARSSSTKRVEKQKAEKLDNLNPFYYGYLTPEEEAELQTAERLAEQLRDEHPVDWQTGLPIHPDLLDTPLPACIIPPPVHIPTQAEVEAMLVQRRKSQLIKEFS